MKKFMTASAAMLLLAGSIGAAAAQGNDRHDNRDNHNGPDMHGPAMAGPAMRGPAMAMHGPSMGRGPVHSDWHKGGRVPQADWGRGQRVDYRQHHLKRPQRGYEWRQVDGNYVLAAAATGLIASILLANQ